MFAESYTPRTWRAQPLHICPPEPYSASDPLTRECLNWIFLISSLNFSFWSEREGSEERYGVEWRTGWDTETRAVHTGYWSLVAALNRGGSRSPPTLASLWTRDDHACSSGRKHSDHRSGVLLVRGTLSRRANCACLPCCPGIKRKNAVTQGADCDHEANRVHPLQCTSLSVGSVTDRRLTHAELWRIVRGLLERFPRIPPWQRDRPGTRRDRH